MVILHDRNTAFLNIDNDLDEKKYKCLNEQQI